jgi:hypothetical protein
MKYEPESFGLVNDVQKKTRDEGKKQLLVCTTVAF